ncbi:MAG TPA: DUF4038 domain-containing protein [Thermoanaerobaculia bacterium]|nr:DUF4038 domain-containing protein [Thermoanaerobaculia bacterium]
MMRTQVRILLAAAMFAGALLPAMNRAEAQSCSPSAVVWNCWEGTLAVTLGPNVDPYRDLKLKVTFSQLGQSSFTSYVFWDGGSTYKFRTAFPASGTWSWSVTCEAGCSGTGFSPSSSSVTVASYVDPNPSDPNPLYTHGLLQVGTSGLTAFHYLAHNDGTPFFWLGDTTWDGPVRATSTQWTTYLADRKSRRFAVVQIALPVDTMRTCGLQPTDASGFQPFTKIFAGCSSSDPIPNSCWRWNPAFWQAFEKKVQAANDQGMAVTIVGLMERLIEGCNNGQGYPTLNDSKIYARNIASRFSGNHVVFSPGFDRKPDVALSTCTASSSALTCRMRTIGQEVKNAAPRHLVTNHWAGTADAVADMEPFQAESWLDFQLFQSGQAKNSSTQLQTLTQRAREIPATLWPFTPLKPNVNGESIYDGGNGGAAPYNAYRARQTAYLSLLSGAVGYTFGVQGVWDWGEYGSDYLTGMARPSNTQMQYLGALFRSGAWQQIVPEPSRIQNQAPDNRQDLKMVLSRDVNGAFLVAYLPGNPSIKISLSGLPSVPRNGVWFDPRTSVSYTATGVVDPLDSQSFTYTAPTCPGSGDPSCPTEPDWVLILA